MQPKRFDGWEGPKPGWNKVDRGGDIAEVEEKHAMIDTNCLNQNVGEVAKGVGL